MPFQRLIAGIRTDLDSFNETEAFALMTSGYNMTAQNVETSIQGFPLDHDSHDWGFLDLRPNLRDPSDDTLAKLLDVASMGLLKIWELSEPLRKLKTALWAAAGLALLVAVGMWHDEPLFSLRGFIAALGFLGLTIALGKFGLARILKFFNFRKTAHQFLVGVALSVAGWFGTWIHILIFDRMYLGKGKRGKKSG